MTLNEFFSALNNGARWDVGVSINRSNALPLDANSVFATLAEAQSYVAGTNDKVLANAYPGQVLAVVTDEETVIYYVDAKMTLQALANAADLKAYTDEQIEELRKEIPTEVGVMSVKVTDDDVIIGTPVDATTGDVTIDLKHAKVGPADGYTGTQEGAIVDAFGESMTIKVPKLTVDEYGHTNAAEEIEYKISLPTPEAATNTVTTAEAGNDGVTVEDTATDGNHHYVISHKEGTELTVEEGTGRTYVTEVVTDDYGHITGVKTATETVVDTNTAHTHVDGLGVKVTGEGGTEGEVKIDLDIEFNNTLVAKEVDGVEKKYLQILDKTSKEAITEFDVSEFVKDGMLESVVANVEANTLTFTWNTDGEKTETVIPLNTIADIYTAGKGITISSEGEITAKVQTVTTYKDTDTTGNCYDILVNEESILENGDKLASKDYVNNIAASVSASAIKEIKGNGKAIVVSQDSLTEGEEKVRTIDLKINAGTPGNVTLTQDSNGLKANIDLSDYAKTEELPDIPEYEGLGAVHIETKTGSVGKTVELITNETYLVEESDEEGVTKLTLSDSVIASLAKADSALQEVTIPDIEIEETEFAVSTEEGINLPLIIDLSASGHELTEQKVTITSDGDVQIDALADGATTGSVKLVLSETITNKINSAVQPGDIADLVTPLIPADYIQSVDEEELKVEDAKLSIVEIAQNKVAGLKAYTQETVPGTTNSEGTEQGPDTWTAPVQPEGDVYATLADILKPATCVEGSDGIKRGQVGLMTPEQVDKLNALVLTDGGVEISGQINAENVIGLDNRIELLTSDKLVGIKDIHGNSWDLEGNGDTRYAIAPCATDVLPGIIALGAEFKKNDQHQLEIKEVNVRKLTQTKGDWLILNGGDAALTWPEE